MNQKIGRYKIIEEIGHGGFAKVYKALDTSLDRLVAIKVMHPALMSDTSFVSRFQREAKIIANLQHLNIIPIHDYGEFEGRLFLVMKLMDSSVHSQIQQGFMTWEQTKEIVNQVSSALDFAHEKDIIHRDIKPENILLDENQDAVIADFGLVKALEKSPLSVSLSSNSILGTPAYLPPEVWNGEDVTPATDTYALACVVYEMLTGDKLFQGPRPPATMALHFRPPQFPEAWPDGIPNGIMSLLEKALAQNPQDRYSSAGSFATALGSLTKDPLADVYQELVIAFEETDWIEAISLAESILEKDTTYKDTQILLQKAIDEKSQNDKLLLIDQWREQAEEAIEQEEWVSAIAAAQQWKQLAPHDSDADSIIVRAKEYQRTSIENLDEPRRFPKWVLGLALIFILLLGIWGAFNFFNNNGRNPIDGELSNPTSAEDEVIYSHTDPPTSSPTVKPTNTPTYVSMATPTNMKTPTIVPSKTPKPTATIEPTSTATPFLQSFAQVSANLANLRSGPGTSYETTEVLGLNNIVKIIAQNDDSTWFNVELDDGTRGWLFENVIEIDGSLDLISLAATIPPIPTQANSQIQGTTTCPLNPNVTTFAEGPSGEKSIQITWSPIQEASYYWPSVAGENPEGRCCYTLILQGSAEVNGNSHTINWWSIEDNQYDFGSHFVGSITALDANGNQICSSNFSFDR